MFQRGTAKVRGVVGVKWGLGCGVQGLELGRVVIVVVIKEFSGGGFDPHNSIVRREGLIDCKFGEEISGCAGAGGRAPRDVLEVPFNVRDRMNQGPSLSAPNCRVLGVPSLQEGGLPLDKFESAVPGAPSRGKTGRGKALNLCGYENQKPRRS